MELRENVRTRTENLAISNYRKIDKKSRSLIQNLFKTKRFSIRHSMVNVGEVVTDKLFVFCDESKLICRFGTIDPPSSIPEQSKKGNLSQTFYHKVKLFGWKLEEKIKLVVTETYDKKYRDKSIIEPLFDLRNFWDLHSRKKIIFRIQPYFFSVNFAVDIFMYEIKQLLQRITMSLLKMIRY